MTKRVRAGLMQPYQRRDATTDVEGAARQWSEADPHSRIKNVLDGLDGALSKRLAPLGPSPDPEGEGGFLRAALQRVRAERRALAIYGKSEDWTWANGFLGGFALAQLLYDLRIEIDLGPDLVAGANARSANRKRALDRVGGDRMMMKATRSEVLVFANELRAREPSLKNWPLAEKIKDRFQSSVPTVQQIARAWLAGWIESGELSAAL
jgi:hypothetical protein